jgi:hypothetical protein
MSRFLLPRSFSSLFLVCLLVAAACGAESPTGPSVPLNERFTLAPSEAVRIGDEDVALRFVGVTGDSRCPADAVCITGGDAIVAVRVTEAGRAGHDYELHTGDSSRAEVQHDDLRIELIELQPYPFSSRPFPPADYRATLRVTR